MPLSGKGRDLMDLECRQETVSCWERVSRLRVEREESGEMIVPDACPDVGTVLTVRPRLALQRKEALEGRAEFTGLLRVDILYRPEEEGKAAAMEVVLPFSATAEDPALTSACVLWTTPCILSADVHLLNSRKVLVKVVYRLDGEAFAPRTQEFLSLVEDPLLWGIRQQTGQVRQFCAVSLQEKAFTCQETLSLPAGQPDPAGILIFDGNCHCREARVVGDKLLFKGEAHVDLICRDGEGELFPAHFDLPFSQVMDGEGEQSQLSLRLTDLTCEQDPQDPRSFRLEAGMEAQSVVYDTLETPVLTDLYSTAYELDALREDLSVAALQDLDEAQETLRVRFDGMSGDCVDLRARMGASNLREEGEDLLLEQQICLSGLWKGEAGFEGRTQTESVIHRIPGGVGSLCRWTAELTDDPTSAQTVEGMEVTVNVRFHGFLLTEETCPVIRRVTLGEKLNRGEDTPSLVIRAVREGQTLWDLAKRYGAAQEDIMAASGLTDEGLYPGQLLLIPRSVS